MESDFRKVLREMRAEEKRLDEELTVLRRSIPGIELMVSRMPPETHSQASKYALMGPREAALHLLTEESGNALTHIQIADTLLAGGIKTRSSDFYNSLSTTLSQLRSDGAIERVEDRWKIKLPQESNNEVIAQSKPAPESAAATFLRGPSSTVRLHLSQR